MHLRLLDQHLVVALFHRIEQAPVERLVDDEVADPARRHHGDALVARATP